MSLPTSRYNVSPFLFILFNKEKIESNAKEQKDTKDETKKWKRDKKR